jgi:hypothetical protein
MTQGWGSCQVPKMPKRPEGSLNHSAELAAVERLLADHWQHLSLVERLKFFLKA